jgi:hypothetical protein
VRIGEATSKDDLLVALRTATKRREDLRRPFETLWWNNIALVAGDHFTSWDPQRGEFSDVDPMWTDDEEKKPRLVLNHALTVARTELAKLTKSHPIMQVMANSDEQNDLAAARVGEAVLDALEWKFKLRSLRKEALTWMIRCGVSAVYTGWDYTDETPGKMTVQIDPQTGEYVFNDDRKAELKTLQEQGAIETIQEEEFPLGELHYKLFTGFQLLPDENATSFQRIQDLITTEVVDIDVLKGLYGKDAQDLVPEDVSLGVMEKRMMRRAGVVGQFDLDVENGCKVHTFWLLPHVYRGNTLLRNGIMVRWCQGQFLEASEGGFPFSDGRMPFSFYEHIPTTVIWPDTVIQHIRGANLEIDKTVSQLIENKDYMANPMWRVATQHRIRGGTIKNVAGSIVRYTHVGNIPPPEPIPGIEMPRQVESLVAGLRDQILDISGQSEVARGRMPSGVRSGVQVAYLQEEDDTKLAPTVENFEEAVAYQASLSLSRVGQFYATQRILRYYRRDGAFDVVKFQGSDLKGNTDVVPIAGSAMPKSKAARQQYTLELVSLGVLQDPKRIEEMLDLGEASPDDIDLAIAQATRENNTMLHGLAMGMFKLETDAGEEEKQKAVAAAVPVKKWHNHEVHLKQHYAQMMDEEFDRLAISHPEIVRLFDEHTAMHEQAIAEKQAQQAQMLMAAKGAPDGPPGNGMPGGGTSFMQQQGVPDVIGGGGDLSARTIRPSPGGGG